MPIRDLLAPDWPGATLDDVRERLTAPGAEFEMEPIAVAGRTVRAYRHAPPTLRAIFDGCGAFDDRPCIVFEDESLTFREHRRAVAALATAFTERYEVRKGDRVVIAMRNWPEWSIVFWASVTIGAIAVPLNAWGTRAELESAIRDAEPRVIALDAERYDRLARPTPASFDAREVLVVRASSPGDEATHLESVIGACDTDEPRVPAASVAPDDPATLLYTSGTSGRAKAAVGTHRNIISNLISRRYGIARSALRRGEEPPPAVNPHGPTSLLCPVPLFHVTGCHSYLVPTIATGNTLVLMYRWSPQRAIELIERERVSVMGGVPTMAVQLIEAATGREHALSSLRSLNFGGAPSGENLVERIKRALPAVQTGNGYGMTETCSLITQNTAEDHLLRPESVGPAVPVCDLRIVDSAGAELPAGTPGEVCVRGANVVSGYWNRPDANAETFKDGWLHTGDVGWLDDAGFLYLVDRIKDVVIRGGENVFCAEVEDALLAHPRVRESAVFGIPDPVLGERVAAAVEVSPGPAVDAEELRQVVAARIAAFKVPERIVVLHRPLPRNAAGKVLKNELREAAAATRSEAD